MVLVVAFYSTLSHKFLKQIKTMLYHILPERIYNPITAMGFSAMLTFQLDNNSTRGKHCWHPIAIMGVVNALGQRLIYRIPYPLHCLMNSYGSKVRSRGLRN